MVRYSVSKNNKYQLSVWEFLAEASGWGPMGHLVPHRLSCNVDRNIKTRPDQARRGQAKPCHILTFLSTMAVTDSVKDSGSQWQGGLLGLSQRLRPKILKHVKYQDWILDFYFFVYFLGYLLPLLRLFLRLDFRRLNCFWFEKFRMIWLILVLVS